MRLLAQARRAGRARREPTDWATLLVAIFVLAGLPAQLLVGVLMQGAPDPIAASPPVLWAAVGLVITVAVFTLLTAIGPVRASAPEYAWVLSGTLDRRSELAPRWGRVLLTTGLAAAIVSVAGFAFGGAPASVTVTGGVLGCAVGTGLAAAATGLQGCAPSTARRAQAALLITAATGVAAAVVLIGGGKSVTLPAITVTAGALVASALTIVAVYWGWRTIARLDREQLTAGNAVFSAGTAAVLFLEPGLVGDLLAERRLSSLRIRRARSFPTGRIRALLTAELLRTIRNRRALGLFVGLLLVPYAAALVAPVKWLPVVAFLCAVAAVSPLGAGFRRISQSGSLRRMIGGSDRALRLVHLLLPAIAAVLFTLLAAPSMPSSRWVALALSPIGVIANLWLRVRDRPPVTNNRVADLGFGPVPIDLTWSYIRELVPLIVVVLLQTWI